jgi:hypothetical protein
MPKFKSKVVEIEAVQVSLGLGMILDPVPEWIKAALRSGDMVQGASHGWLIKTLEGEMRAGPGDWIIRGTEGELYPCKPSVFERKYEPAGDLQ